MVYQQRTPLLGELMMATTTRFGFHKLIGLGNPRGLPKAFLDEMFDNFDAGTKRAVLRLYRATSDFEAMADTVVNALAPRDLDCCVLWGKADIYLPWRFAEAQREAFPRAQVAYLDDSGHWPFMDNPEGTAAAVVPFLQRVAAAR